MVSLDAYDYFTSSTGGNNRKWANRYKQVIMKFEMLKETLDPEDPRSAEIIKGYGMCLDALHRNGKHRSNEDLTKTEQMKKD